MSKKTAKVTLTTSNKDMLSLLRSTDTAYLYIKDTKGTDKDIMLIDFVNIK